MTHSYSPSFLGVGGGLEDKQLLGQEEFVLYLGDTG